MRSVRSLFGYKEAYLARLLMSALLAFYVSPLFWIVWLLYVVLFLAHPYDPQK